MPRRVVGPLVDHSLEQVADGLPRQLRGITGSSALKGHASVDPDSELIMATKATAGNVGDAAPAPQLLAELVAQVEGDPSAPPTSSAADAGPQAPTPAAYGDSAYGTGPLLASLHPASIDPGVKVQAPVAPGGHFTKDQFQIELGADPLQGLGELRSWRA
jgi:hypothetical protein